MSLVSRVCRSQAPFPCGVGCRPQPDFLRQGALTTPALTVLQVGFWTSGLGGRQRGACQRRDIPGPALCIRRSGGGASSLGGHEPREQDARRGLSTAALGSLSHPS